MDRRHAPIVAALAVAGAAYAAPAPPVQPSALAVGIEDAFTMPAGVRRINALGGVPDGSGRLFVVALEGPLFVVRDGAPAVYLDVAAAVGADFKASPGLSSGLVSFAFHPDFATNGRFYTVHTEFGDAAGAEHAPIQDPPSILAEGVGPVASTYQHSVLTEWTAADPGADVFAGSSRELMRLGAPGQFHPMGDIGFDPTLGPTDSGYGLLYIAVGDGMSYTLGYAGNDPTKPNNMQRLDCLLGAVLRIDPDGDDGPGGRYGVPTSNPFAALGDPGVRGEIYAYGFRNPHRFAWDPISGDLFAADIGEDTIEEAGIVRAGENHGWAEREGPFLVGGGALDADVASGAVSDGFAYPVAMYDHGDGTAIAGLVPLRSSPIGALDNRLLFGDISTGRIFVSSLASIDAADDGVPATTAPVYEVTLVKGGVPRTLLEIIGDTVPTGRADLRFGRPDAGDLYLLNKHDRVVRRLVARPCAADLTIDGVVDGADLGALLGAWGDDEPGADLTADGVVDGADLGVLLGAWGACIEP
jgi:hypothetical protein